MGDSCLLETIFCDLIVGELEHLVDQVCCKVVLELDFFFDFLRGACIDKAMHSEEQDSLFCYYFWRQDRGETMGRDVHAMAGYIWCLHPCPGTSRPKTRPSLW